MLSILHVILDRESLPLSLAFQTLLGFVPLRITHDFCSNPAKSIERYTSRGNDKFDYYFWIPIVGPLIGAVFGALIYKYTIGDHLSIESSKNVSKDGTQEEKTPLEPGAPVQDSVA